MSPSHWATLGLALCCLHCSEEEGSATGDEGDAAVAPTSNDDGGSTPGPRESSDDDESGAGDAGPSTVRPDPARGDSGVDPAVGGNAGDGGGGTSSSGGSGGGGSANGGAAGEGPVNGGAGGEGAAGQGGGSGEAGSAGSGAGGAGGTPNGGFGGAPVPTAVLTVSTSGSGEGTVVSEPAGLDCGETCEASFAEGSTVVLTAAPLPGSRFLGFSGGCSGKTCSVLLDEDAAVGAEFEALPSGPPNVAFVTSTTTTGDMGGLEGADQLCSERALAAGLSGTFVAWLSSSEANAIDRLDGAGGWLRPDGKPFANDPRGPIYYPLRIDEFGNDLWVGSALTGTSAGGTVTAGQTCQDWTVATGSAATGGIHTTTASWTSYYGGDTCVYPTHIYCFGIDSYADVTPSSSSNRLAFLSEGTFTPGDGIASADELCQAEATAHGESGTFRALLATASASAMSRFDVSGQTWVRPDGVEIIPTPAALFPAGEGAILDAPINLMLSGEYTTAYEFVWTGIGAFYDGRSMQTPGVAETTCNSWQSSSENVEGASGYAADTNLPFGVNGDGRRSCELSLRVYCLED